MTIWCVVKGLLHCMNMLNRWTTKGQGNHYLLISLKTHISISFNPKIKINQYMFWEGHAWLLVNSLTYFRTGKQRKCSFILLLSKVLVQWCTIYLVKKFRFVFLFVLSLFVYSIFWIVSVCRIDVGRFKKFMYFFLSVQKPYQ